MAELAPAAVTHVSLASSESMATTVKSVFNSVQAHLHGTSSHTHSHGKCTHLQPMYTVCPRPWHKLVANSNTPLLLTALTSNTCEPKGQDVLAAFHDDIFDKMYTHESKSSEPSASA